ncbi:hypothetical protein MOSE0_B05842 [Monosporozyma servazzii]
MYPPPQNNICAQPRSPDKNKLIRRQRRLTHPNIQLKYNPNQLIYYLYNTII